MREIAWTSEELRRQYDDLDSGHFFDPETMRFFRSRLSSSYRRFNSEIAAFITTERFVFGSEKHPRRATIRIARLVEHERETDGRRCQRIGITTFGDFNALTLEKAQKILKKLSLEDVIDEANNILER